ncbi:hypothetical protein C0993_006972 [Termitomyces sp. T159_Od127]|nr:hypothetical protein C0993_006972 [Termitomyces sp. T159_Od127]
MAIAVDKAVAYMRGANPSINPSCFYSGSTGHYQAQISLTEAWIGKKDTKVPAGCRVIGEVVENFAKANPEHIRDWSTVSKVFAESVSGKVYVLLGEMINPDSIWLKYERDALKKNGKVIEVEVWKVEADGKLKKTNKTKETM